jgi:DnaJ-class molecular chaperone
MLEGSHNVCLRCQGTKGKLHIMDYGESAWVPCIDCKGTGKEIEEKEPDKVKSK